MSESKQSDESEWWERSALFDVDLKAIESMMLLTGSTSEEVRQWSEEARKNHKEMMDTRMGCPNGCMHIWREKKHMDIRLMVVPVVLMLMTPSGVFGGFILTEENDAFTGSDDYYTQGLELLWTGKQTASEDRVVHHGYGVKNVFYTPQDIESPEPSPSHDRPWAGYTAIERKNWVRKKTYTRRADWMIGTTGEWSGSEQIQTEWHKAFDSKPPAGWDNQIPKEVFVSVTVEYYKPVWAVQNKPEAWGLDVSATAGGSAGTAFVNGEIGAIFRAGWNLPADYWTGLIKPTDFSRYSFFAFAEETGRLVGHNMMLGGSLFRDGPSRDLEPFVSDSVIGGGMIIRSLLGDTNFGLTYRRLWRSDEFKTQSESIDAGSVVLSFSTSL